MLQIIGREIHESSPPFLRGAAYKLINAQVKDLSGEYAGWMWALLILVYSCPRVTTLYEEHTCLQNFIPVISFSPFGNNLCRPAYKAIVTKSVDLGKMGDQNSGQQAYQGKQQCYI